MQQRCTLGPHLLPPKFLGLAEREFEGQKTEREHKHNHRNKADNQAAHACVPKEVGGSGEGEVLLSVFGI